MGRGGGYGLLGGDPVTQTYVLGFKPDLSTREGKRAYDRERRRQNRPKYRARAAAYYRRNTEKVKAEVIAYIARKRVEMQETRIFSNLVWRTARARATAHGLEFSIKQEDYPIPEICPALGIPLDWSDKDHAPTLDRIDNSKGYTADNVVIVSNKANRAKNDLTVGQIVSLGRFYDGLTSI